MSEIVTVRDIEMVTSDIRYAQRQGARQLLSNLIEIGRLLVEAKSMVPYGEWGKYLEEKVDYSQSTANNLMKLYQEYGDSQESFFDSITESQAFGKMTYTQALALLTLPAEERRDFAESHDAEKMSSREWEKAIRERDEALKERVYQTLRELQEEGVFGIGRIYTAEEAREEEQLYGDFSFVVESDGYTSFGDRAVRPLVQNFDVSDYRFGRATHGYMPDYGPQPVFVAKGPDIKEGVVLDRGRVVDEAPTFAKLLNLTMEQADGKPVDEILK